MRIFDRIRGWFSAPQPPARVSVLRQLLDVQALEVDPVAELDRAAVLVRGAGLEHLVTEVTYAEIEALVKAGAVLAKQRAVILADTLADLPAALEPFDGGDAKAKQTLDWVRRAPMELS